MERNPENGGDCCMIKGTWRTEPRTPYRVFPLDQPAVAATIDGVRVLACPSLLRLSTHTPIPVYNPATREYGVLEVDTDDRFSATGSLDDQGYNTGGDQIPPAIVREMLDWAEEFVRAHPDTPLIPRQTGNAGFHGYQTTKSHLLTFNAIYEYENNIREHADPGVRRAPYGDNIAPFPRAAGSAGPSPRQRGASTRAVDMARRAGEAPLFDGDSGGRGDGDAR